MSTYTKEQLIARIHQVTAINKYRISRDPGADGLAMDNELLAIALASLEAEPVAYVDPFAFNNFSVYRTGDTDNKRMGREWMWANPDAGLIPVYAANPAAVSDYPETLPCPVMLEPGLRFGKGVNTKTMLGALQRRSEYHAELEAMTPEKRADHDAGMKEFAAMLQGAEPVTKAYKLPSREHFISLCNQFWNWQEADEINAGEEEPRLEWNGSEFTHRVTQALWRMYQASPGNSPVIPDGWVACSERMPPQGDYVSVVSRHGEYVSGLVNDEWLELHDGTSFGMDEIYLWVPLPAVPQREA